MSDDRKTIAEMIGEGVREVGLLLFVFAPLDFMLSGDGERRLTASNIVVIVCVALALFFLGVAIERRRR